MFEGYVKDGSKLSVDGAAANMWFLTLAGSLSNYPCIWREGLESTVTAICFILWEIVSRPKVFEIVLKEVNEAFPTWEDVGLLQLEKLPYLNAAIYEGMR